MPRVVKPAGERRRQLLECARRLFFEKGYEKTTVADVIAKAGLSKGAFYHHFRSKEELLEALAAQLARQTVASAQEILDAPALDSLGRLNAFLARAAQAKVKQAPSLRAIFDVVFRPENVALYHRLHAAVTAELTPVLERIVAQGIAEGRFRVSDAKAAAELLLQLGASTYHVVAQAVAASSASQRSRAVRQLQARLRFHGIAIDRILGLPDGSVRYVQPGFARALLAAAPTKPNAKRVEP